MTTVNGQFQGALKIAFLSHTEELKNTLTTLISFFFFLGYLLNSSLGGGGGLTVMTIKHFATSIGCHGKRSAESGISTDQEKILGSFILAD